MPRRRSELEDMLSSLVSTNDTIDNVFVGGYSLRRRKTGGGKGDDGFGSPKSSVTPAVTRTTRKSKKPQEHLVAMTEPRPSTRRLVKASKALLSPVEDLSFQRSPSLSPPPPPPPLDFETDDVEDTIAARKRNRRGKERKDGLAGRGKTANQEVDKDEPSKLETDSGQVDATENNHFVEEEEEMEEDKQREDESGDNEDDIESTCQEDQTSYAQKMEESDPSDRVKFDSDQQFEDDDSELTSQVIDSDQEMDSNETDQESESVRLSKETESDMQLKSSQKPRIASDDGGNAELKVKLMNEMHRMRKIADYGKRNMERFPTEELKSVAAILKSRKKEVSVAVNENRTKRPKKSKIPATVNSRVRKGSKVKVLLAMPGRECLKSTSAESARHFMQERLYNSSQYKREPAGKRKENSESIDNTTSYCIYGRYALLRRDKVIKA